MGGSFQNGGVGLFRVLTTSFRPILRGVVKRLFGVLNRLRTPLNSLSSFRLLLSPSFVGYQSFRLRSARFQDRFLALTRP